MSKSTISTFELFRMFPDQESARVYFEARRWPDGATCPACGEAKRIGVRKGGFYRCNACLLDFTIRTGTIFERSKVPLHKWLYAMYLLVTARKGISSVQLHAQIGVTQKTAWFMLQRLHQGRHGTRQPGKVSHRQEQEHARRQHGGPRPRPRRNRELADGLER
jgi:transposase-like protein